MRSDSLKRINHFVRTLLEVVVILMAFFLTNLTSFSFATQFPDYSTPRCYAWMLLALCSIVLIFILVKFRSLLKSYLIALKNQLTLILFVLFCLASMVWSTYREASLAELSMMFLATLIGIYLAVRYKQETFFNLLRYFAIFAILASFALVVIAPYYARLDNPIFNGAWRGVFWHRNHMGSLMAFFSSLFLLQLIRRNHHWKKGAINLVFFLLSAVLVFNSRSATGILIFLFLNTLLVLVLIWFKIRHRLKRIHYGIIAVVGIIVAILILSNLDFIFGLLGRNTTLTGRIPLWEDLLKRVWPEKPIFGFGFGALWNQSVFRISLQEIHGWFYEPFFADNGFLDILLNLGVIGLVLFLVYFITTGVRSINYFFKSPDLLTFLPLLTFVYILLANISFSFFFEVDQFVWMLLVIVGIFSVRENIEPMTPRNNTSDPQP